MTEAGTEQWLPVVGFEGLYEVSDQGQVRGVDRTVVDKGGREYRVKGRVRRQVTNGKNGYYTVSLHREGKQFRRYVHQMVLEAFVSPRPNGMEARHMDDVREHNFLANLAWGTRSENNLDMVANGGHRYASRAYCKNGHEYTPENIYRSPSNPRKRSCRECGRATAREWMRKKRAKERAVAR